MGKCVSRIPVIRYTLIPGELFLRILAAEVSNQEIRQGYPDLKSQHLQNVLTYADSVRHLNLEERFHLLMHDGYWVIGNLTKQPGVKGYWANRQLGAVRDHCGLTWVKRSLATPDRQ